MFVTSIIKKRGIYLTVVHVVITTICSSSRYYCNSAAHSGNVQRLKSYAAAGADPISARDMYGRTALHAVCISP